MMLEFLKQKVVNSFENKLIPFLLSVLTSKNSINAPTIVLFIRLGFSSL